MAIYMAILIFAALSVKDSWLDQKLSGHRESAAAYGIIYFWGESDRIYMIDRIGGHPGERSSSCT